MAGVSRITFWAEGAPRTFGSHAFAELSTSASFHAACGRDALAFRSVAVPRYGVSRTAQ